MYQISINLLLIWYGFHVFFSRFAGTCTQGDDDRFIMGAILSIPAAFCVCVLLNVNQFKTELFTLINLTLVSCITLYLWNSAFYWTSIHGNHICFLDWGDYVSAPYSRARLVPVFYMAFSCVFISVVLKNLWDFTLKKQTPSK